MTVTVTPPVLDLLADAAVRKRLAAFDRDEFPSLSATRDPWALAAPVLPDVDTLLGAWLARHGPDGDLEWIGLAGCDPRVGVLVRALSETDSIAESELRAAVAAADRPDAVAGAELHVAVLGAALLGDDECFRRAHERAETLLIRFERRKHALGLTYAGRDAADMVALGVLRATWRTLTAITGDPRFLNGALKLADWTRMTVADAAATNAETWHGLRAVIAAGAYELSPAATALHLLAASREREAVAALRGRR